MTSLPRLTREGDCSGCASHQNSPATTPTRALRYRSVPIAGDAGTTHCIRLQVSKKPAPTRRDSTKIGSASLLVKKRVVSGCARTPLFSTTGGDLKGRSRKGVDLTESEHPFSLLLVTHGVVHESLGRQMDSTYLQYISVCTHNTCSSPCAPPGLDKHPAIKLTTKLTIKRLSQIRFARPHQSCTR